ncbi:hypothetical protein VIGAN_04427800 [Vigna angularis var. angularis]|uniref:Uncharacterized protein n=1 Tax=Vigna angularis var. angularis TaxID=157739 RepID=A0A0S3S1F5_PHAAN|nr:hypothetical protein VIGAN_04427800 [Vigna angularis var. angularis]
MSLELQQHQTNGKKNQQCMVEKPESHYHCSEFKQRGEQYHFNIALGYTQSLCIRNNDFILYLHDNVSKNVSSRLRLYPIQDLPCKHQRLSGGTTCEHKINQRNNAIARIRKLDCGRKKKKDT